MADKKVAINPQSSIQEKKDVQPILPDIEPQAIWCGDYHDIYTQRRMPISPLFLGRLAQDLVKWASESKEIILEKFFVMKGIDPDVPKMGKWDERSPEWKRAFATAKKLIGYKREEGGLRNKLNVPMVMRTQGRYDPRWLPEESALAAIKASASDKTESTLKLKIVSDMVEGVVELEDKKEKND